MSFEIERLDIREADRPTDAISPVDEYEYPAKLPSNRYKYSQWHDLKDNIITGDQLHAPRIRKGPEAKEKLFYSLSDDNNSRLHHDLKGRKRKSYRDQTEKWEGVRCANLSYQEMQHDYQKEELTRVVGRLKHAEQVMLMENEIIDLSSVSLPSCISLNLARNHIEQFKMLPNLPIVQYVNLADNNISQLRGLKQALPNSILVLDLRGNPAAFLPCYRQRVFRLLPSLRDLDGVLRLPEDDAPLPDDLTGLDQDNKPNCIIL